jgi:hypothetical protein
VAVDRQILDVGVRPRRRCRGRDGTRVGPTRRRHDRVLAIDGTI